MIALRYCATWTCVLHDITCIGCELLKAIMSPTVFKEDGFRFFFFSSEEERMHVHVISGDGEAKFWLDPEIELAKNYKYSRQQLKQIKSLIEVNYNELIGAWQKHFGS